MGLLSTFLIVLGLLSNSVQAQDYVPGEVIVKMRASSSSSSVFLSKARNRSKMSLKRSWSRFNMHQFALKPGVSVEQMVNDLQFDPDVEYAEPNYILRKQSVGIEGEPFSIDEVQGLALPAGDSLSTESFRQTSAEISANEAWGILSSTSHRPIVAIIDSGIDYNHYVFTESGAIWVNSDEIPGNGIDDDGNGFIDDVRGWNFVNNSNDPMDDDNHGTHVAGIVLGITQDILRKSGEIQPAKIQLMALKFLDQNGSGTTSSAISAIQYAMNNGAKVLNNSWGGGHFSQALNEAIIRTHERGLSFIAAAGNSANDNDASPTYPASYQIPNVVSIAATSSSDTLASFSNFGQTSVHVGSPGISIISALPGGSFGYSSGTSMAAPFAAGLAALMLREKSEITGFQIKGVLYEYSQPVQDLSQKVASESRIDALSALDFVQTHDMATYQPGVGANRGLASTGGGAAAGGCGMVQYLLRSGGRQGPMGGGSLSFGLLVALLAPLALILLLRREAKNQDHQAIESRRQFPRYQVDSQIGISIGDQKLVAQMSSISMGGVQINTEALLKQGGVIRLSIATHDGQSQVDLQGQVVWCEEKKAYGVKFLSSTQEAIDQIAEMTRLLAEKKSKA